MKSRQWVMVCAAAAAGAGAVLALQALQAGRRGTRGAAEAEAAARERPVVKRGVRAEPRAAAGGEQARPAEVRALKAEPAAAAGAGATAKAPAELQNTNFMQAVVGMMKDPKMKEMLRSSQVMAANQMYAGLPRYLNLSAEKRAQLDKLLGDRQFAQAESGMAILSGTEDEKRAAIKAASDVKAEYDKAISELLGKDDYEVFQKYEESMPDQMQVTQFKGTLPSDLSLSEQQEYDLTEAMYQARKEMPATSLLNQKEVTDPSQVSPAVIEESLGQLDLVRQRTAEQAGSILSSGQLERFKTWQQQMAAMETAAVKMMFAVPAAKPAEK